MFFKYSGYLRDNLGTLGNGYSHQSGFPLAIIWIVVLCNVFTFFGRYQCRFPELCQCWNDEENKSHGAQVHYIHSTFCKNVRVDCDHKIDTHLRLDTLAKPLKCMYISQFTYQARRKLYGWYGQSRTSF